MGYVFLVGLLVAAACSGSGYAASRTTSTTTTVATTSERQPVLGRARNPYQRGYGSVRPSAIDSGGDPTGIVEGVR